MFAADKSRIIVKIEYLQKNYKKFLTICANGGERYGRHFLYSNGLQPLLWDGSFQARMKVTLYKEPDNKYDKEAIRVEARALGKIGYVANSRILSWAKATAPAACTT